MPEQPLSSTQKLQVAERANYYCEYCRSQERFSPDLFSVEHIMPRSKGGSNLSENLAYACQGCNNRKYTSIEARDPVTQDLVPLFHPRRHRWSEHFAWSVDGSLIIGLTPVGRATVEKLQLNRSGLSNLRTILFRINEHPCQH